VSKLPFLPLWTEDYLGATRHLSTTEHGAYLLLLMEAWRRPACCLPDDDGVLARLAGMPAEDWAVSKANVMAFWKRDGRSRTWTQLRLKSEADKAAMRSKSASDKSAKRWKKAEKPDAEAMPQQSPGNAIPESISFPDGKGGQPLPSDQGKALFDAGIALLTAAGSTEKHARALIAGWRRERGDEWTRSAIASAAGKNHPISWIEKRKTLTAGQTSPEDEARAISSATAERYRRMNIPGPEDWQRARAAEGAMEGERA
jgi:uncharacterized protein YdaU (DUF1376 family)